MARKYFGKENNKSQNSKHLWQAIQLLHQIQLRHPDQQAQALRKNDCRLHPRKNNHNPRPGNQTMGCLISMFYIVALELKPVLNIFRRNIKSWIMEAPPKSSTPLTSQLAASFTAHLIEIGNVQEVLALSISFAGYLRYVEVIGSTWKKQSTTGLHHTFLLPIRNDRSQHL